MEKKKIGASLRGRFGAVLRDIDLSKVVKGTWQIPNTRCLVSLGEGAFGPMNICENRVMGQIALEKVVRKDEAILGHLKEEIRCLTLCKSAPEILNMTAFSDSLTSYQLYLERFNAAPLNRLNANRMNPWILGSILASTGKAFRFIHSKGIVHRQLTGQNILVRPTLEVKITGFDVATVGKKLHGCVGVLGYMAPEVVAHSYRFLQILTGCNDYYTILCTSNGCPAYNHLVDYYTLGITVFEMFFDQPPAFMGLEIIQEEYVEDAILFNMREADPIFPVHELEDPETFKVFQRLLENLLIPVPAYRCADNKFKKHKVLQEVLKQKPKKTTAVDLESLVKVYKPHTAALAKLWYDPSLQFGRGGDLKDIFFYLTTRPTSHRFWEFRMNRFYPDNYDEYIAYWNQVQSGPAVEATVEEIENVLQESSVETAEVTTEIVGDHYSDVSLHADVTEEELVPHVDALPINEIVVHQQNEETEDSRSTHSAVEESSVESTEVTTEIVADQYSVVSLHADVTEEELVPHVDALPINEIVVHQQNEETEDSRSTHSAVEESSVESTEVTTEIVADQYSVVSLHADVTEEELVPHVDALPINEIVVHQQNEETEDSRSTHSAVEESSVESTEVTTEIVADQYSVVSLHADVTEEELVPHVDALPINEIVVHQQNEETEDSRSTHSAVEESSVESTEVTTEIVADQYSVVSLHADVTEEELVPHVDALPINEIVVHQQNEETEDSRSTHSAVEESSVESTEDTTEIVADQYSVVSLHADVTDEELVPHVDALPINEIVVHQQNEETEDSRSTHSAVEESSVESTEVTTEIVADQYSVVSLHADVTEEELVPHVDALPINEIVVHQQNEETEDSRSTHSAVEESSVESTEVTTEIVADQYSVVSLHADVTEEELVPHVDALPINEIVVHQQNEETEDSRSTHSAVEESSVESTEVTTEIVADQYSVVSLHADVTEEELVPHVDALPINEIVVHQQNEETEDSRSTHSAVEESSVESTEVTTEIVADQYSVVSLHADVTEEELVPHVDALPINEIVVHQQNEETEDSRSTHSAVEESSVESTEVTTEIVADQYSVVSLHADVTEEELVPHVDALPINEIVVHQQNEETEDSRSTHSAVEESSVESTEVTTEIVADQYSVVSLHADVTEEELVPHVDALPINEIVVHQQNEETEDSRSTHSAVEESSVEYTEVTTEIVADQYSVVSLHADVTEEELVPHVDALPINEIVVHQQNEETEDSRSTHSAVEESSVESTEVTTEIVADQYSVVSLHADVMEEVLVPDVDALPINGIVVHQQGDETEDSGSTHSAVGEKEDTSLEDDDFITCVILWIAFVILCLFFFGKSVFNICTRSGQSKNSTDHGDEGGIDHGDSPGKGHDLEAHADDLEDHGDVFGQDGEGLGDHVDELADPGGSSDPGDLSDSI